MAKKRKRNPAISKYSVAINKGRELLNRYWGHDRSLWLSRLDRVYAHYSRESIQKAMYEYAMGRKIAALRSFRPLFTCIKHPEDILMLAFYFAERGKLWPSLHGTISRSIDGKKLHDLVLEVDFKSNWKVAFESARPLVHFLQDFGIDFKVKFSGHSSPHIIIPAEAFPPGVGHNVQMQILDYANKYVKGRAHLDTSFRDVNHFLRLAYSINEQAGMVSVPIDPDLYDRFNPNKAKIDNVEVLKDWWTVSPDAPERTSKMISFILERKMISIPQAIKKPAAKQFKKLPAETLIVAGEKARSEVMRRLQMPYEQMLKTGNDILQRRNKLMDKVNVREAFELLKSINDQTGVVSTQETAVKCGVAPDDLWFLWRFLLRQKVFDYYARDDVQEAMFLHSIDRKVRLGSEDIVVDIVDPADILPLAVYIHETQGGVDYPAFYCTNVRRDATTDEVLGCDVAVRINGRGDGIAADQMAQWVISLLRQAGVDFAVYLGEPSAHQAINHEGLQEEGFDRSIMTMRYIIIPSEAVPGMPRHEREYIEVIESMGDHIKRALPRSEGVSILPMGEYIPLFYSVNETSGIANVPIRIDKLDVEMIKASLDKVKVIQDWWEIPGETSAEMEELFASIMKPV